MLTLKQSRRLNTLVVGLFAWAVALLLFFPIFWMLLTSLKTEIDAFATPPQFIFTPTLENYLHIQDRSGYFKYAWNSVTISFGATALGMLIAIPPRIRWPSTRPSAPRARCSGCSRPRCCRRWACWCRSTSWPSSSACSTAARC